MSDKDLIERVARASEEVERPYRELDITNADRIEALTADGARGQGRVEPCGECHLQPGERCDIFGAKRP